MTLLFPYISLPFGSREPMEISAVMRDADSKLWAEMRSGMEQAASDLGVELRFLIPASESAEEQEDLIRREMERGTDGIILTPVNNVYIEENVSFGEVPVVSLEEPLLGSWKTISPDNEQIGKQLAEFGVQGKKAAAVLLVSSYPKSEGMTQRIEAAEQVLNEAGIQTQLYKGDLPSPMRKMAEEMGAEQIIALDSKATLMAAEEYALSADHPQIYGVGSSGGITSYLEKGVLTAVAAWSKYAAGYLAVEYAAAAIQGRGDPSDSALKISIIKGDEIYEPENQKLLFPVIS
ncbi:MAG: substrate-binding domain-containing protein [Acutalibacteraceae bacterium]